MISISMRLLIVWLLVVVAGTLAPFDFGATIAVHEHSFRLFQYGAYERDPVDFVLNVLLFLPLGAMLQQEMQRRSSTLRTVVVRTAIVGLCVSATLEYFQQFLPSRDSSAVDVMANTLGGVIGVFGASSWGGALTSRIRAIRTRTSPAALSGLLAFCLTLALLVSGALQARTHLSNWSAEYPLLVGNERTGDRPWHGHVFSVTMTDAAASKSAVRRFAVGETVALPGSTIASFDFNGGSPYRDRTGHLPALVWTYGTHQSTTAGVTLTSGPWLQTEGAASALAHQFHETNAFSIRIECATDDASQNGPARILSNSVSPLARNFTVGQVGGDLVFRLRTPQTGFNGYPLETIVPDVFTTHAPRDILLSYDGATLMAAVAREERVFRTEFDPGAELAPLVAGAMSRSVRTGDLWISRVTYLATLFLPPGILIALLAHSRRARLTLVAAYLLMAGILLEATLVVASGRNFDAANVALVLAVGGIVLTVTTLVLAPGDLVRKPEELTSKLPRALDAANAHAHRHAKDASSLYSAN
jgi:VanZ family protein